MMLSISVIPYASGDSQPADPQFRRLAVSRRTSRARWSS